MPLGGAEVRPWLGGSVDRTYGFSSERGGLGLSNWLLRVRVALGLTVQETPDLVQFWGWEGQREEPLGFAGVLARRTLYELG